MNRKNHPNPLPKILMGGDSDSPMTSPIFKSSPLSGPNTPLTINMSTSPPGDAENVKEIVMLPTTPSQIYKPPNPSQWEQYGGGAASTVPAPPLPPKPKKSERRSNVSPPPPLPPKCPVQVPKLPPRATPIRGVLESRSPHMDPVDPRREHNLMMQQMNSPNSHPPPLGPRRHSNVVNGSGKIYFKGIIL